MLREKEMRLKMEEERRREEERKN